MSVLDRLLPVALAAALLAPTSTSAVGVSNGSGPGRAGNISTSGSACTAATLVTWRGGPAVLTAGHCTRSQAGRTWRQGSHVIGSTYTWTMGAGDYGAVRGTASVRRATGARDPRTGQSADVVTARGTFRGKVVGTGDTQRYSSSGVGAVTVRGLAVLVGVCLRPGDSGSGVWQGRTLVGVADAVGRAGRTCVVWFTPAATALHRSGMKVR